MAARRENLGIPVASGAAILVSLIAAIAAAAFWLMPPDLPDRQWLIEVVGVGGAIALLMHFAIAAAFARGLRRRLRRFEELARRIEAGDRAARLDDSTDDELGDLARAVDGAWDRVSGSAARVAASADSVAAAATRVGEAMAIRHGDTAARRAESEEGLLAAAGFAAGLEEQSRRAAQIEAITRAGAEVAVRSSAGTNDLAHAAEEAEGAGDSAAAGATAIAHSLNEVARRAETVAAATASTSSAIAELNATIHQVRAAAESAAALAQRAGLDAERGQGSLAETLDGIDRIREASHAIRDVTIGLEGRAKEIGVVLQLVGDLTERTNLLALNASIIAAQAGVEGRGFAVVAAEIKNLSNQTKSSASEIAALVAGVEEDAHAARRAAELGAASVEEGRDRARSTAATLAEIFQNVRESAQLSLSIATATDEQVRASSYVAGTMEEVTASIEAIAQASADHKRQGDALAGATARLKQLSQGVTAAARVERNGAQSLARTLADLTALVTGLAAAQQLHADEGMRLHHALVAGQRAGEQPVALAEALGDVGSGARALREEADRLR